MSTRKTRSSQSSDQAKLWRLPNLGNLELLHASYVTQTFARHTHDGFAVGVIEKGALGFFYRGENLVASTGMINLANPDEAHTGHAAAEAGWTYRMFYLDIDLLQRAASEIVGRPRDLPFFQAGVINDPHLAGIIRRLHFTLETADDSRLEQESRILWMLTQLILRHADDRPALRSIGKERHAVRRACEYIEDHSDENISLNQLAHIANLSPFHFIRVFRSETGLPPHAYLTQVRVKRAKAFLSRGWSIASTAFETGFADQSHLTRCFKRITGVTPGQYSNIVQDR